MSFLIKGVTDFLGLTDTPGTYLGQAAKRAQVNAAEDALEFGAATGGLDVLTEENFVLFAGAAPGVFTDLQIADATGNKPQGIALIEFDCAVGADRQWMTRMNGETLDVYQYNQLQCARTNSAADNSRLSYVFCPTDVNGVIEWRCSTGGTNVTVTLRGFVANTNFVGTMPEGYLIHSGAAPGVWTGITLGTGPCLAIVRCVNNDPGFTRECQWRRYGDTDIWQPTPQPGMMQGIQRCQALALCAGYALTPTDSEGRVQWGDTSLTDWDIYLLAYIKNVTMWDLEVYNATTLDQGGGPAYFQTLDLPIVGQSLVVLKEQGSVMVGGVALRQTGISANFPYESGGANAAGTRPGYHLQMTNDYGQVDYCSRFAEPNRAWLHANMLR